MRLGARRARGTERSAHEPQDRERQQSLASRLLLSSSRHQPDGFRRVIGSFAFRADFPTGTDRPGDWLLFNLEERLLRL